MERGSVSNGTFAEAARGGVAGVPLFHAAWLFAAGIALTAAIWMQPGMLLISLVIVTGACAAAALRAQRMAWAPMALLWVLLGAWCAKMEPHPAPAEPLHAFSDGLLRTVEGTVTSAGPVRGELEPDVNEPSAELPSQRVDVKLASIEVVDDAADRMMPVNGTVRLTMRWAEGQTPFTIGCGERIRAAGRLLPPQRYRDPGAWDRAAYLLDQGVTSTATVKAERVERLGVVPRRSWPCLVSTVQHAAAARLLALPATMRGWPGPLRISQEDAIMLAAMVTGDRTFLSHSLRVGFERTGSFHMLVVSGLHLAIAAGFIAWIARRLRVPRVPATLITIAASFGYAMFTGFATPVQRSLWMVTLYLVGRLIYRERSPLNTIGFAVLCLLVASPRSLFDASFQMTLLAVVSIAGIAVPLLKNSVEPYKNAARDLRTVAMDVKLAPRVAEFRVTMRMIAARMRRASGSRWVGVTAFPWTVRFALSCAEALVVTLVVELAMTLPMVVYFHRVTLFALPVNLFILPLLLVLMPAALVTLLVAMISPAVAAVPGAVTAALLHIGVGLVRLFGSGFGTGAWGDLRMPAPVAMQVAAFCVLLAMAIVLARLQRRWMRRAAWAALIAAAAVAVAPRAVEHPHDALLVEAIDVGQGDSLLIVTPDGKTLLVDGGGFGGGPRMSAPEFDIGEEVVSPALWARGIRHLDAVALSHAHSDHMGGLPAVLRNFHPDELWVGNNPPVAPYESLLGEAAALHTRVRALRAGDAMTLGAAQLRVLAPLSGYAPKKEPSNNDSLVLRVAYGASSVMLEGDAESPIERGMLDEAGLESTLLKVGHHGSTSSSKPEFLAQVHPRWAVISCGLRNRYGHPREEVLEELQTAHVRTAVTDVNGAACFSLDGKTEVQMSGCGER